MWIKSNPWIIHSFFSAMVFLLEEWIYSSILLSVYVSNHPSFICPTMKLQEWKTKTIYGNKLSLSKTRKWNICSVSILSIFKPLNHHFIFFSNDIIVGGMDILIHLSMYPTNHPSKHTFIYTPVPSGNLRGWKYIIRGVAALSDRLSVIHPFILM